MTLGLYLTEATVEADDPDGALRSVFNVAVAVNPRVASFTSGLRGGDLVVTFEPGPGEAPLSEAEVAELREALKPGPRVRFEASERSP